MFGQVGRTPYDIEFSLLGIPARIHPLFWLVSVIFGWRLGSPDLVVIWVMCVFLSILVHEMGHALMARAFGYWPHIVLHHFGGYASFTPGRGYSAWTSIAILLAGPLAGFVFFGVVLLLEIVLDRAGVNLNRQLMVAFGMLGYINLYWGLVNLLPVLPLDGGQICRDVLSMFRRVDSDLWSLRISVGVGFAMALLFYRLEARYAAVLFGLLALMSLQSLGARNERW